MYAVASHDVGRVDGIHGLEQLGAVVFWVALVAWALVAGGLLLAPVRRQRG
jgi:tellurite resistance protein TehA-like permease